MKSFITVFFFLFITQFIKAQVPCENGMAGEYPCNNIDLLSHVTPVELMADISEASTISDLWGWTDPLTNREYAIVGMINAISFVDVTDPVQPIVIGTLLGHNDWELKTTHEVENSIWKDIKTYQNHAFIVSEARDFGMQVFNLERLRDVKSPPALFVEDAHYDGVSNAHNIVINPERALAYIAGARNEDTLLTCRLGGLHIVDISNPLTPQYLSCFDDDGYTHDAQCVTYQGADADYRGHDICLNANEDTITIIDITDPLSIVEISKTAYDSVGYIHQGWLTEDHRYFISNDEVDEFTFENPTRTYVFDLQDLDNPQYVGFNQGITPSIDHNLYIHESLVYQSNYSAGLRILSLDNVEQAQLEEIAFFDTYPLHDSAFFLGSWSNYPYFNSGTIIVSDKESGLFVVKPQSQVASIKDLLSSSSINVYPQPAIDQLHYSIEGQGKVAQISLISVQGIKMQTEVSGNAQIDVSGLSAGVYLIEFLFLDGRTIVTRFVKE